MHLCKKKEAVFGPVQSLMSRLLCMLPPLTLAVWFCMLFTGTSEMVACIGKELKINFGKVGGGK